jgi:hypothetical protein
MQQEIRITSRNEYRLHGLRKIAFEGSPIWEMPIALGALFCWMIMIGFITVKVFRWE